MNVQTPGRGVYSGFEAARDQVADAVERSREDQRPDDLNAYGFDGQTEGDDHSDARQGRIRQPREQLHLQRQCLSGRLGATSDDDLRDQGRDPGDDER